MPSTLAHPTAVLPLAPSVLGLASALWRMPGIADLQASKAFAGFAILMAAWIMIVESFIFSLIWP